MLMMAPGTGWPVLPSRTRPAIAPVAGAVPGVVPWTVAGVVPPGGGVCGGGAADKPAASAASAKLETIQERTGVRGY